jgi:toxin ParE1/3/4
VRRFEVVITTAARGDLRSLRDWIAADDPPAARRFVAALGEQIARLESLPLRGPVIPEAALLGSDLRHLVYRDYRTIYRVEGERVIILRVIHGARLLRL